MAAVEVIVVSLGKERIVKDDLTHIVQDEGPVEEIVVEDP